ncbi:MAG: hypothetical protein LBJ47_04415 [Tannerella sp.]|nr:hypothetical protein [Tannerella sp.]
MVMCIAFIVVAFFLPVVDGAARSVIACAWIASSFLLAMTGPGFSDSLM